jgi:uncharacterized metal-binding protein
MSYDGWLHEKDAIRIGRFFSVLSLLLFVLATITGRDLLWHLGLGFLLGSWAGYWVTPDIDHQGSTREEYRAMRTFIGALWVAYMIPYSFWFSHRSKWSHSIYGTFIRILWVLFSLPIVIFVFGAILLFLTGSESLNAWLTGAWKFLRMIPLSWGTVAFLSAWAIQDMQHYKRDRLGYFGLKR